MTPLIEEMEKLYNAELEHIKKFKVKPNIIGYFGNDITKLTENIINAIETNKPYNEYELLSDEEKKAFDKGELLF